MSPLEIIFEILLSIFALVMIGLTCTTAANIFRLRNKRLSWRAGTLKGFPLFSTLFLLVSLGLLGAMCAYGGGWKIASAILYIILSCAWFIASYYSSKRYITDNGIVKNVNEPGQTVAWHQINDFIERKEDKQTRFVFFYHQKHGSNLTRIVRLPLEVPSHKLATFKKIVAHKLGQRLHCYEEEGIDISELENL